jgi:ubiquinone/menaquinone biosynthesis C-methylase UbiE
VQAGFNYEAARDIRTARSLEDAVRLSVINCLHYQLGWPLKKCLERTKMEIDCAIPKGVLDALARVGWRIAGAKLLDVGAGQGGTVLESLSRGADAYGIEPGEEFRTVARSRLAAAGQDSGRILSAAGESLPFPGETFDYLISLQVLEHVPKPELVMKEMYRVLKPGGQCYITCENYLSFREPEYGVPWLPMLPKSLGAIYLRAIGRNPHFLEKYVHYSTYPQIWTSARRVGFQNVTLDEKLERVKDPRAEKSRFEQFLALSAKVLPKSQKNVLISALVHLNEFWRAGVRVRLVKPCVA